MAEAELLAITQFPWVTRIFSGILARMVLAVLIILIGIIVGKVVGRLVQRILKEAELKTLSKKMHLKVAPDALIGTLCTLTIYFIAIIAALNQLGLTRPVLFLSASALLIILIISTFLGLRSFFPNLVAGFKLKKKYPAKGKRLRLKGLHGRLEHIGMTETLIETETGDKIYVPNATLSKAFQEG
ncbi:MAG: mechanosensitive ion channel domain-containing protein [Candidatus Woesearchaeota archaeon]